MANPIKPGGLSPVKTLSGSPWTGKGQIYCIPQADTNAYYQGDLLVLAGSASAGGVPTVTLASAGGAAVGVFQGAGITQFGGAYADPGALDSGNIVPATKSKDYYCYLLDDPNIIWEIEEVATGTQMVAADVGLNCNVLVAAPASPGRFSATMLDNTTKAVTATLNCKLLRLAPRVDNVFGVGQKWWVLINNHQFRGGIAGV